MSTLIVKAKHFKETDFCFGDCALEKAALEKGAISVNEHVCKIVIDGEWFSHKKYGHEDFIKDEEKARLNNFDDTIIRKIDLTPIN